MTQLRRIPPIITPIVEKGGTVSAIWYRFLQALGADSSTEGATALRFFFQQTPPDDQNPVPGDVWVDSITYIAYTWLNANDEWVELGPTGPRFYQQDDLPSDAREGDWWLDTTTFSLYLAIVDNDQITWVELGPVQL